MFNSALRYKLPERNALAAITRTDDNLNLFMQFWFDCGKKESLSNEIIAMWRSRSRDLPKLVRIEGLIDLSPTTIDIRGPAWRDKSRTRSA